MIIPPFLRSGATVAITCPSGYLAASHAEVAKETLTEWGFRVVVGDTVGNEYNYFSGDDDFRLQELQSFLDNPEIGAILAGRGGYGLSRIIDRIDFTRFLKHPKWLIGFSDITVLHAQIHSLCSVATIHGPMCHAFMEPEPTEKPWLSHLQSMLNGYPLPYSLSGNEHNREGEAKGMLTGGNLAILAHLCGSRSQAATKDKILFIEDVSEYIYAIDRMLLTLKRAGMLQNLAGLICGGFSELKDTDRPFGAGIEEIVLEKVAEYGFPVCFGFPAGHIIDNYPLMLGGNHCLKVTKERVELAIFK